MPSDWLSGAWTGGIAALERAYQEIVDSNLIESHLGRLAVRAMLGRRNEQASRRVAEVTIANGITPGIRFGQARVRLAVIGANLDTGKPVIYGQDPGGSVLDGLLASMALPPWFAPAEKDGELIIDGGVVSNLPIEAALALGATEIVALDLDDPRPALREHPPVYRFLNRLIFAVTQRQKRLETALAEAHGVSIRRIELRGPEPVPLWDFGNYRDLIQTGFEIGCSQIAEWAKCGQEQATAPGTQACKEGLGAAESDTGPSEAGKLAVQHEDTGIGSAAGTDPAGRVAGWAGAAIQPCIVPCS